MPADQQGAEAATTIVHEQPYSGSDYPIYYGGRSVAGIRVTPDKANTFSAYFRAVSIVSGTLARLPWRLMREDANGDLMQERRHPMAKLFRQPNPDTNNFLFRRQTQAHVLTWGNAYCEIERSNKRPFWPVALWPIEPHRVTPRIDERNQLYYEVSNSAKATTIFDRRDIFHLMGLSYDGLVGYPVAMYAANSVGVGLASQDYSASFFANGTHTGMVLMTDKHLSPEDARKIVAQINEQHAGPSNAHKVFVAHSGNKVSTLDIKPEEAQLLATRQFQVQEIARWFGVPPHMLGDHTKTSYNSIEAENQAFHNQTMGDWFANWEAAFDAAFLADTDLSTNIDEKGLLRGDSQARANYYRTMYTLGAMNSNEIRRAEGMPGYGEDGDVYYRQANMSAVDEEDEPMNANPLQQPPQPPPEDDEEGADMESLLRPWAYQIALKLATKEFKAASQAIKRGKADDAWCEKFYQTHNAQMVEDFGPIAETAGRQAEDDVDPAAIICGHCEQSKLLVLAGKVDEAWTSDRVSELVDQLMEVLTNA